jgi:hypothetical protein
VLRQRAQNISFAARSIIRCSAPVSRRTTNGSIGLREFELFYLAIFIFGSLARYHPNPWAELNSGRSNLWAVPISNPLDLFETKFIASVSMQLNRFNIRVP